MIKNQPGWRNIAIWLAFAPVSHGCSSPGAAASSPFQGVVELEELSLGFELAGRVSQLLVREGEEVEAGTVLARLDDELERSAREAQAGQVEVAKEQVGAVRAGARSEEVRSQQARVDAARATEDLLERQAARERLLASTGALAPASLDQAEAQLKRARAERESLEHGLRLLRQGARREDVSVAEARAQAAGASLSLNDVRLERHELRAPATGTILDVGFELGEVVSPGVPVVTLADLRRPYVDVFVPQAEIAAVSWGQPAQVRVDSLRVELPGHVEHIARRTEFTPRYLFSENERATLVVRVRVRVDDERGQLRAGVPAFVRWGAKTQ